MTEPTTPKKVEYVPPASRAALEADIARTRAELGRTVDALTTRLSPSYQASQLAHSTKLAAGDARALLTGDGLPDGEPNRARNAKVLLGAVAAGIALVAITVVRVARR